MLISLGSACKVRNAIQRSLQVTDLETNMFDWVVSNFESVLYFLQNIDTPITENDFYDSEYTCMQCRRIFHKNIRFESIHDCNINNAYENELPYFLEKYNRRLNRLKNHILNNAKINFIHLVDIIPNSKYPNMQIYIPNANQIEEFHNCIKKINPNCFCYLHILIPPAYCKYNNRYYIFNKNEINELQNEKTYIHYLEEDKNKDPGQLDQCHHWSWENVFHFIESSLKN